MSNIRRRNFLRQMGAGTLGIAAMKHSLVAAAAEPDAPEARFFVGTYTCGRSQGVYIGRMDLSSGTVTVDRPVAEMVNPSFLARHPTRSCLYAVSEVWDYEGAPSGAVAAFAIDPRSGDLRLLNRQSTHGGSPCHLVVEASGRFLLVANYRGGSVAVLPLREDGSLGPATDVVRHEGSGPHPQRQEGPHAHSVTLDPANRFVFVADLGIDRVLIYRLDAERGKLAPGAHPHVQLAPGAGPRHFAFHPDGRHAYVINELDSTLTALSYHPGSGALEPRQTIRTIPADFAGDNACADVHVAPSGRFVYGSNRGHDSIAVFSVAPETGELKPVQHESTLGRTPRNFAIDPTGRFLLVANQDSDSLVAFAVHAETGRLSPIGSVIDVPTPVCVRFA